MTRPAPQPKTSPEDLEGLILALIQSAGGKSIEPTAVARAALPDHEVWHRLMPQGRAAAVRLARAGRIAILRKGKPVDPDDFKGVYRLAPAAASQGAGNSADERPVSR